MNILVAEDVAVTRRLLEVSLRAMGHHVTGVADGVAALEAFARDGADLLVLDWFMPGATGVEVCRQLRASEAGRDVFVLMLTSRDGAEDLETALEAGVDDYLTKPVTPQHLAARIAIAERGVARRAAQLATEEALRHARWLAGVGETTLAMQHEINNPLGCLSLLLELELSAAEPGEHRETLELATRQAQRIADVVRRMAHLREPRSTEYLPGMRMLDVQVPVPDDGAAGGS